MLCLMLSGVLRTTKDVYSSGSPANKAASSSQRCVSSSSRSQHWSYSRDFAVGLCGAGTALLDGAIYWVWVGIDWAQWREWDLDGLCFGQICDLLMR